jgi:hypothetical protein
LFLNKEYLIPINKRVETSIKNQKIKKSLRKFNKRTKTQYKHIKIKDCGVKTIGTCFCLEAPRLYDWKSQVINYTTKANIFFCKRIM